MFKSLRKKIKTFHGMASGYCFFSSWLIPTPSFIELPCVNFLWRSPMIHAFVSLPLMECDLLLTSTYGKHDGGYHKHWLLRGKSNGKLLSPLRYIRPARERVVFFGSEEGSCHAVRASMKRATWKLTVVLADNRTLVKQPQEINYACNLDIHGNYFFPSQASRWESTLRMPGSQPCEILS